MTAPEDIAAAMNAGGRALGPDLDCIRHIDVCYVLWEKFIYYMTFIKSINETERESS